MKYGLRKDIIEKINTVFADFPLVDEAVIYGSRAKGNFKNGSDIDISLKGDELSLKELNKISYVLDDLLLPYTFDLSIYHNIDNPDLSEHIRRVGKTFYSIDKKDSQNK